MHNRIVVMIIQGVLALVLSACGALEIGIEHVPPNGSLPGQVVGEINWRATAESLQAAATDVAIDGQAGNVPMVNPQVVSPLADQAAPTFVPTPVPMPTLVPPSNRVPMVAFVQGGNIWVRPVPNFANRLDDGDAVRLTFDGRNAAPQWSTSGDWLTFVKNPEAPELWVMRRDGSEVAQVGVVASWDSYAWSPTTDRLAVAGKGSVLVYDVGVGMGAVLISELQFNVQHLDTWMQNIVWAPDGMMVAFTLFSGASTENEHDGLWVFDVMNNIRHHVLTSELPERGEFILHGWAGGLLLYSQAPILSASMLSDGVPLYSVQAFGDAEPVMLSESVVPHPVNVQSQQRRVNLQAAFVEGSGREMWHNKRLRAVTLGGGPDWMLSPEDQAVTSPVWSPDGNKLAYIAMPDVGGVGGGDDAEAALMQRKVWIVEENQAARLLSEQVFGGERVDAVQWIDQDTLLVALITHIGEAKLLKVDLAGQQSQMITGELTPRPEWFGYYGYIDWSQYFDVWQPWPETLSEATMLMPTPAPVRASDGGYDIGSFIAGLHPDLTADGAIELWGEPEAVTGSGLMIYIYRLSGGATLWLSFPGSGPLTYAHVVADSGARFALVAVEETGEEGVADGTLTPTPTPAPNLELMPTVPPPGEMAVPTATPFPATAVPEATATPLATMPMPEPTVAPIPGTPDLPTPTPMPTAVSR